MSESNTRSEGRTDDLNELHKRLHGKESQLDDHTPSTPRREGPPRGEERQSPQWTSPGPEMTVNPDDPEELTEYRRTLFDMQVRSRSELMRSAPAEASTVPVFSAEKGKENPSTVDTFILQIKRYCNQLFPTHQFGLWLVSYALREAQVTFREYMKAGRFEKHRVAPTHIKYDKIFVPNTETCIARIVTNLKDKFTPDKATLSAFLPAPSNDQPDVLSMVGKGERTANDPGN